MSLLSRLDLLSIILRIPWTMAYGFLLWNAHSFHRQYACFNLYLLCFDLKPLVHVSLAMFPQLTL